ncbi:MAG: o-succinylbenzoate synthase [Chloroflexota bacterium]
MKIDRITLRLVRMPLRFPFETSFGRITSRDCVLIEMHAGGLVGYGECVADYDPGYSYETSGTSLLIMKDFLAPAILGKDFETPAELQRALTFVRGHLMSKAGLEMALWDLLGKRDGRSLRQMLGAERTRVEVGVSVGLQDSPAALVETVQRFIDQGYGRVKIKIKPGRDLADTRAVRQAFPNLRLQVDANSAYRLPAPGETVAPAADARVLLPLDELDLLLIEQPLDEDDLWDHARLQRQFKTAICLDETIISARHARQALEMGACRIVNIKAGRVGGLSEAAAIHDLCLGRGVPVWCGGMLETGVGRASNLALAALPGFSLPGDLSATERYYFEDITHQNFTLNPDSTITVPDGPGLGVEINPAVLERVTVSTLNL